MQFSVFSDQKVRRTGFQCVQMNRIYNVIVFIQRAELIGKMLIFKASLFFDCLKFRDLAQRNFAAGLNASRRRGFA